MRAQGFPAWPRGGTHADAPGAGMEQEGISLLTSDLNKTVKKFKLGGLTMDPTDGYYDHTTFAARSLSEFIKLIEAFADLNQRSAGLNFFYRGMADSRWKLIPSLMRSIAESHAYALEHDLAVEFKSEVPDLFQDARGNFETIAKMQHFGIPTRLLDFTLNPLIALYFACSGHPRSPGRVVFTLNKLHHFDDPCVECTSSLYLIDNCNNISLDKWVRPYNLSVSEYLFDIFTNIYSRAPLFVKPLYLDERMRAQRSVFLLFHNYVRDLLADCRYYKYKEVDPVRFQHETIEDIYKEQIENPRFGYVESPYFIVDKRSFKRLTDSYRRADMDHCLEMIDAACEERFYLQDMISPLEMDDIWQEFSSVIIPAKCKKAILSQLRHIGIDEAYVYPEAEHIAQRIKRQM